MNALKYRLAVGAAVLFVSWSGFGNVGVVMPELKLEPASVAVGAQSRLLLTLQIADGWHVYGKSGGDAGQIPLQIKAELPDGIEAVEQWQWPPAQVEHFGKAVDIYQRRQVFALPVRALGASGKVVIRLSLSYQACKDEICAPPEQATLAATLRVEAPADGEASGALSEADRDWQAFEEEYKRLWWTKDGGVLTGSRRAELEDAQLRRVSKRAAEFFDKHPGDPRRWTALGYFVNDFSSMPWFVGGIDNTAEVDRLYALLSPGLPHEEYSKRYIAYMRAVPRDAAAREAWLREGNRRVAQWVACAEVPVAQKEDAEFMLFGRDMRLMQRQVSAFGETVDWRSLLPRFIAHIRNS
jgi:hypothetical protein